MQNAMEKIGKYPVIIILIAVLPSCGKPKPAAGSGFEAFTELSVKAWVADKSEECLRWADSSEKFSRESGSKEMEVLALLNHARAYLNNKAGTGQKYADSALRLSAAGGYDSARTLALAFRACFYFKKGEYLKSCGMFDEAVSRGKSRGYIFVQAMAKSYIGEALRRSGSTRAAYKNQIEALRLFDSLLISDSSAAVLYEYGSVCNSLGILAKSMGNFEEGRKYYSIYLNISKIIGDEWGAAIAGNNLANILSRMGQKDSAIAMLLQAEQTFRSAGADMFIGDVLMNLGNNLREAGRYKESDSMFELSHREYSTQGNTEGIAMLELNRAESRLSRGQAEAAFASLKRAEAITDTLGEPELVAEGLRIEAAALDSAGEYRRAVKALERYYTMRDSLTREVNMSELQKLSAGYEFERKLDSDRRAREQKEKTEQEKQARRYNLEYLGVAVLLLLMFAGAFLLSKSSISPKIYDGVAFVALVLLFEFLLVLIDPYSSAITRGEPLFTLMLNIALASLISPVDQYLESKLLRTLHKEMNSEAIS